MRIEEFYNKIIQGDCYDLIKQLPDKTIDLVLDCFAGSGTTLVACKELNRNFIGFEINEDYYKVCIDRLDTVKNGDDNNE